jgi:hypothetical protein
MIERTTMAFAQVPNIGLIIVGAPSAGVHRNLIITLAARQAGYVDRILEGEKPAFRCRHQPSRAGCQFQSAKVLGLDVPQLHQLADELIE